MKNNRLYHYQFGKIYVLYVQKVEKKGRTIDELNEVLSWLTGYDEVGLRAACDDESVTLEVFFNQAPQMNPNANLITGVICGYKVQEIEDPLTQKIRWMDKLVDELAKGKSMDKILRS